MRKLGRIKIAVGNKLIILIIHNESYTWETNLIEGATSKEVNVYFSNHHDYILGHSPSMLGYLFDRDLDKHNLDMLNVHQATTTLFIFLSAVLIQLRLRRNLTQNEQELYNIYIEENLSDSFETVFIEEKYKKGYTDHQVNKNKKGIDPSSEIRIKEAFYYFNTQLESKDESYLKKMLNAITNNRFS